MLEEGGIATVAIASIRPQVEKVSPPRALWVPFELGRPLGEPGDAAFQHRVLAQALALLQRPDGPVLLEDFPDDAPGAQDRPGWHSAVVLPALPSPLPASPPAWAAALSAELAAVAPFQAAATRRFGHSTVGLFGQNHDVWPGYAAAFLDGHRQAALGHAASASALRFLVDDVKAFYAEAAQSAGPPPSSRQLDQWFWRETLAARFLRALRHAATLSDDAMLKTFGGRFFVPTAYGSDP